MSDDKNTLQKTGGGITPVSPASIDAETQKHKWNSPEREELDRNCGKMRSPDAKAVEGVNLFLDKHKVSLTQQGMNDLKKNLEKRETGEIGTTTMALSEVSTFSKETVRQLQSGSYTGAATAFGGVILNGLRFLGAGNAENLGMKGVRGYGKYQPTDFRKEKKD